eukprot:UN23016
MLHYQRNRGLCISDNMYSITVPCEDILYITRLTPSEILIRCKDRCRESGHILGFDDPFETKKSNYQIDEWSNNLRGKIFGIPVAEAIEERAQLQLPHKSDNNNILIRKMVVITKHELLIFNSDNTYKQFDNAYLSKINGQLAYRKLTNETSLPLKLGTNTSVTEISQTRLHITDETNNIQLKFNNKSQMHKWKSIIENKILRASEIRMSRQKKVHKVQRYGSGSRLDEVGQYRSESLPRHGIGFQSPAFGGRAGSVPRHMPQVTRTFSDAKSGRDRSRGKTNTPTGSDLLNGNNYGHASYDNTYMGQRQHLSTGYMRQDPTHTRAHHSRGGSIIPGVKQPPSHTRHHSSITSNWDSNMASHTPQFGGYATYLGSKKKKSSLRKLILK